MLGGVVLCGGESRRMGQPKAWLRFGSEFLLQRVVRIVGEVAEVVVVVAAEDQALPDLPAGVAIVRDPVANRGPLQGLATGLRALPDRVELAFVSATDTPLLRAEWIRRIVEMIGPADLGLPEVGGRLHPLSSVCRRDPVLRASDQLLGEGRSRLLDLIERVRTVRLDEASLADIDPFFAGVRNLNTPEEYERVLAEFLADRGIEVVPAGRPGSAA